MEPVTATITFHTKVKKLEQKRKALRATKDGDDIRVEYEDLGWFILFEGSWEYLHVGYEEPSFKVGDPVIIRISHANPRPTSK